MKKTPLLLFMTLGLLSLSCEQKSKSAATGEDVPQTETAVRENLKDKFLITSGSVGYFKIDGSWQDTAKNSYNYKAVQGYGTCTDACCDGGFLLGNKTVEDEYGISIEHPESILCYFG